MQPKHVLGVILVGMAAVLAACGGGNTVAPNETGSNVFGQSTPAIGPMAPSFSVTTGGGSVFSLNEHRGETVILYFSFAG